MVFFDRKLDAFVASIFFPYPAFDNVNDCCLIPAGEIHLFGLEMG